MNEIHKQLAYFAECYQADNREFVIDNFYSSKFDNQYILDKEELVGNTYPKRYLPLEIAEPIKKELQLFKNDKELLYCSLFLLGRRKHFNKKIARICAPIFYYPATLVQFDEDYFVRLELDKRQVNYGFLRSLDFKTSFDAFVEEFQSLLQQELIDYPFVAQLQRLIDKHTNNVNGEELLIFPDTVSEKELKKVYYRRSNVVDEFFEAVSVSGLMISSKANNVEKVVNELQKLQHIKDYSRALKSYLNISEQPSGKLIERHPMIPMILNEAQEKILNNAYNHTKSVIVGPPGTGKTFTVTAIALDYIAKGKSVLIVTKTPDALSVIEGKLKDYSLSKYMIKAGGSRYKSKLMSYLRKLVYGFSGAMVSNSRDWGAELQYLLGKKIAIEKEFEAIDDELAERTRKVLSPKGIIGKINKLWIEYQAKKVDAEWLLIDQYYKYLTSFELKSNKYIAEKAKSALINRLAQNREELVSLLNAFATKNRSVKQLNLNYIDFKLLTEVLPIWLTTINEVSEVLPLQKEIFDVLIIDEATQCDMASCLSLMQRAKKVVITGDPQQLRHISFLSTRQMLGLQHKYQIELSEKYNFRNKSLLDFALENVRSQDQVVLLNEHFRSLPSIISFSNKEFYFDALRIMTDLPENKEGQAVSLMRLRGIRNDKGINHEEVKAVVQQIHLLIEEEKELQSVHATSIGIISPFSDQVKYFVELFKSEFTLEIIKKHDIRVGTPYSFQGDERDIIYISMAVDSDAHPSAMNYLNRADVFNVMITRARNRQDIFISCDIEDIKHGTYLRSYLEHIEAKRLPSKADSVFEDNFVKEVTEHLKLMEMDFIVGYQLSGMVIDILVVKGNRYLGIDLLGYPGDFQPSFSLERYRILYRLGIKVIPVSYLTWKYQRGSVIVKLNSELVSFVI